MFVYKLIAEGTVEEKMVELQQARAGRGACRARRPPSARPLVHDSQARSSRCVEEFRRLTTLSFPKEQVRILLLEGIHENAVADLGDEPVGTASTRRVNLVRERIPSRWTPWT